MISHEYDIFYVTFGAPFDPSYTPRLEGTVFVPLRELLPDPPENFSRSPMPKVLNPLPTMVPGTSDWGWKLMPYRRHYY